MTLGGLGIWWNGLVFYDSFRPSPHEDGFWDELTSFVGNTVVPAIVKILVVVNPALGLAAAATYELASKIIAGRPLTNALLDTAIDQAKSQAGSEWSAGLVQIGLNTVRANAPGAMSAIDSARSALASRPGVTQDDLKSFMTGVVVGQTQQIQQSAQAILRTSIPTSKQGVFDQAMSAGMPLVDTARALLPPNTALLATRNAIVDATKKINPSADTSSLSLTAGNASGGGNAGGSSSLFAGGLLLGVAYGLYRLHRKDARR